MDYKSAKVFMESVKNDDVFSIKSDLEGLIILFKGDKSKCDEAIEYAINNSSFDWEKDDGLFFSEESKTTIQKYCFEKGRLVQNFTKERYLKVLELYKHYESEHIPKPEPPKPKSPKPGQSTGIDMFIKVVGKSIQKGIQKLIDSKGKR
ncbi:MAG: hypothetical protein ACRC0Y_09710 [Fusobacteriaceae bacterium]